jgi:cobalt-zinc-cadmium efflux system protein
MPDGHADDAFLQDATQQLHDHFDIDHVTLQVMRVPFTTPCAPHAAHTSAGGRHV